MLVTQFVLGVLLAPLLQGAMKSMRARLSGRPGPSVMQPYRDLRKLMSKEALAPMHASWIFLLAPGLLVGVSTTVLWLAPSLVALPLVLPDAVAIALTLALGRFILVLAALDSRSGFEGMAASREMTFAALTEAPMILALASAGLGNSTPIGGALAAVALVIVMLAETARIPIDNQETHYELTMIHEGMVLEYSGWQLALTQMAAYIRQIAFFALVALLLPGDGLMPFAWMLALAMIIPMIERALAKLRLFEVPQLFTTATLLALASIGLRIVGVISW